MATQPSSMANRTRWSSSTSSAYGARSPYTRVNPSVNPRKSVSTVCEALACLPVVHPSARGVAPASLAAYLLPSLHSQPPLPDANGWSQRVSTALALFLFHSQAVSFAYRALVRDGCCRNPLWQIRYSPDATQTRSVRA